ncbi:MAG: homoserine kinase [Flavobacteriales bacterium]
MKDKIKIVAPATMANLNCGFDAIGLAVDYLSDEVIAERTAEVGARIKSVEGAELPMEAEENVMTVAANSLLKKINADFGIDFHVKKLIRPGSGLGSSAASAVVGAFAANYFSGETLPLKYLIPFAMEGEFLASGSYHADNIAPAMLGGITLISGYTPLVVNNIPSPQELYLVGVFQHVTVKTSEARAAVPHEMSTRSAVKQAAAFATLISGLYTSDYGLIARSQEDKIAEPFRKNLIPNFDLLKETGMATGALASGISGSGPTMFFMCEGKEKAEFVKKKLDEVLAQKSTSFESFSSRVADKGVRIV